MQQPCDNCKTVFDAAQDGCAVYTAGTLASAICPTCLQGASIFRIVLRRQAAQRFGYEQFSVVEGLPVPRAVQATPVAPKAPAGTGYVDMFPDAPKPKPMPNADTATAYAALFSDA